MALAKRTDPAPFLPTSAAFLLTAVAGVSALPLSANADILFPNFSTTAGLQMVGDTHAVNGTLEMTPAASQKIGAVWADAKQPVAGRWTTTFQFRIAALGGPANTTGFNGGDGFVFVVQNAGPSHFENTPMARGGGLGYNGMSNILAVEFDTWKNTRANDPSDNHVSVLTNGAGQLISSEDLSIGSSSAIPALSDGSLHTARIDYTPGEIRVFVDDLSTPAVVAAIDLGSTLDLDNGTAWVGFTAATGGSWQSQEIVSWSFSPIPTPGALALAGLGGAVIARRRTR